MTHFLDSILNAKSVAIVGASQDPGKRGYQAVRALLDSGYPGAVFPVHPAGGELLGLQVARDISELETVPDLAFICTRAELVADIVAACSKKGIKGVAVPAVGFRESGGRGEALERKLQRAILNNGTRLVGPNTSGILNSSLGLNLVGVKKTTVGKLGLLAQSGNVALDIITRAERYGIGLSTYVGVGNETDISFHE